MRLELRTILLILGAVGLLAGAETRVSTEDGGSERALRIATKGGLPTRGGATLGNLLAGAPVLFEPNHGQFDPEVRFASRTKDYHLFVTGQEAVFVLPSRRGASRLPARGERGRRDRVSSVEVVRMRLRGAREPSAVEGMQPTGGVSNYYRGGDPNRWREGVPHFRRVDLRDVYPGIDLTYRGTGGRLEFDFLVAPGADAGSIRLAFEGASSIEQVAQGDLVIETGGVSISSAYARINRPRRRHRFAFLLKLTQRVYSVVVLRAYRWR